MGLDFILDNAGTLPKSTVDMALRATAGFCPFCNKEVNSPSEFRDALSLKEHRISGLCQKCQDKTFGK